MDSVPKHQGPRLRLPGWEQHEFRCALMDEYRATSRYQNLIKQDARPHWLALRHVPNFNTSATFKDCEQQVAHPDYRAYVEKVRWVVEKLALALDGEPAGWAATFVHDDVTSQEYGDLEIVAAFLSAPTSAVALKIDVSPAGADLTLAREEVDYSEHRYLKMRDEVLDSRFIEPAEEGSFSEWEVLERAAHALVSQWIANTRQEWRERYAYRRTRYAGKSIAARDREDIHALFHLLWHNDPVDHDTRRRLLRLCATIGVALPEG